MSESRSRSVSRSRVIKISSLFPSGEELEPTALLEPLLTKITDSEAPLTVILSDSSTSVSYNLNTFLSKSYEVSGEFVLFGFKKIKLKELKVKISFELTIEDDT